MSEAAIGSSQWYSAHLYTMLQALRKDMALILIGAVVLGAMGAAIGKLTNKSKSKAQLVLTPMPLRANTKATEDNLAIMMATPLDVTSLSLICMGDEVLERTLKRVNESNELSAPIKDITKLKTRLSYQITIAKETPYELTYAPILELTAKCSVPKDAKVLVNAWGAIVSEAATRFQDAVQQPAAEALDERVEKLGSELEQAELESEKFWTENNVEYYKLRLNDLVGLINRMKETRTRLQCELFAERASLQAFTESLSHFEPTIKLQVQPSKPLLDVFGGKWGLPMSKEDASKPSDSAPLLTMEHINTTFLDIQGKIAASNAGVAAKEAELKETLSVLDELESERLEIQAKYAQAVTGRERVERKLEIASTTFKNIKSKHEYAQVAGQIKHPVLQVISEGAEWPLPRFRRAILFGAAAFCAGLAFFAAFSVVRRMILQPVFGR
ncbi:MAG TPA: hypothetical protein PKO36_16540 [Candidatus Hydrogenedentes bacterium]|nr:hypothetical protein [Candidatus Hydrogenedentota bacterium]HOV73826.1 hypothetical protein [Candidatus Hydrogenedentota bacterium]HPC14951.1 hypothetical protein [Candidatus Hydrogenedentota bacterium]HRT18815.1 hypothetical protein [Candidatus Hydrogenedentota bacterium]HRT65740.1 hypothetical protein [Candidatus Hydrogenedentota bacterium]